MRLFAAVLALFLADSALADTVSLQQLQKLPAKAQHMRQAAERALQQNDSTAAVIHMERLVSEQPDNVSALHDLGALYLAAGRPTRAVLVLEQAAEKAPALSAVYLSLGRAYLELDQPTKAEQAARRALKLTPNEQSASLVLAKSLVRQHYYNDEALRHLRRSQRAFPEARLWAANVLIHMGDLDQALVEVEAYLASGDHTYDEVAHSWSRLLRFD